MHPGIASRLRRERAAYYSAHSTSSRPPSAFSRRRRPHSALHRHAEGGLFAPLPSAIGLLATKGTGPARQCARWPGHAIAAEEHEQVYRSQLHLTLELLERASDGGMIPSEAKAQQDAVRATLQARLEQHTTAHSTPSLADLCQHRIDTGQPQQPWTPQSLPIPRDASSDSLPSYGDRPNHATRSASRSVRALGIPTRKSRRTASTQCALPIVKADRGSRARISS